MTDTAISHLKVIINSLELANRRGAFTLGESAAIHNCIKFFTQSENKAEKEKENIEHLLGTCNQAQRRGAFDLNEAYVIYPHVKYFLDLYNQPPPETTETTETTENIQQEITKETK